MLRLLRSSLSLVKGEAAPPFTCCNGEQYRRATTPMMASRVRCLRLAEEAVPVHAHVIRRLRYGRRDSTRQLPNMSYQ